MAATSGDNFAGLLAAVTPQLFAIPGVTGVVKGQKLVNGAKVPAVVIYVNKKLPPTECATLIPSTLTDPATGFSAPTDVVERAKTGPSGEDMGELGATGSLLKKSTARFDDDMSAFDDL
ncbi:hypothetical protein Pelo_763 [Pelomyxa schiedti]|nr:hypothetical protein Pelo_763 [Pelomyxa schiedti]